jgi:hypothetical protein
MKTAVEWLVAHFKKLQSEGEKMSWNQIIQITELTKEMEKKQKMDFANWCRIHENLNKNKVFTIQQLFDKYQKETFKSE